MSADDELGGCGYEYDHAEDLVSDDGGVRQYVCRQCGAEWFEDDE